MRKLTLAGALALVLLVGWLFAMTPAGALATITVTTTDDVIANDGLCSLREAIIAANTDTPSGAAPGECPAGSGADVIEFSLSLSAPAVFVLTNAGPNEDSALTGDLDLMGTLTINGAGFQNTIVDGDASDRVFEVRPGAHVTITGLTIRNGDPGADLGGGLKVLGALTLSSSHVQVNQGGGIRNEGGIVTLSHTQVLSNTAGYALDNYQGALSYTSGEVRDNQGGGIRNSLGTATLTNVSILGNTNGGGVHNVGFTLTKLTLDHSVVMSNSTTGSGGGIFNEGVGATVNIVDTRISSNTAAVGGGGVFNNGTMTVERCVVDHNQAGSGGGVDHFGGTLALTNDTLSSNIASDNGGGLYNRGSATLTNVTLSGNQANGIDTGGNIFNDEAQLSIRNSIVAYSDLDGNCFNSAGFLNSLGHNLDSADTCGFGAVGDLINTDPLLGPLQDNGGATWTHALLPGSPAIGAGDNDGCPDTDQRGVPRPQGAVCDIGSFEWVLDGVADLSVAKVDAVDPVTVGDDVTYTITVTNSGPDTALNAGLTDDLPGGVVFVSATPDQGNCSQAGGVVTCDLGDIANGSSVEVVIVVTTTAAGTLTNQASASSDLVDLDPGNNSASEDTTVNPAPVPEADLSIGKTGSPNPVDAGATLTYTLVVTNAGPDTATAVTVTDQLPDGVTYGGAGGDGWNCDQAAGLVTCTRPSLAIATAPGLTITVTAPDGGGTITNSVSVDSVTSDPNLANNIDSEQTVVTPPSVEDADLSIGKTGSPNPVDAGATLTYTLVVTNAGPDTATAITVTDQLPSGVTYGGAGGDGWNCGQAGGLVTCTRPSLAVGLAPSIRITVTAPGSSGTISNTVTVSSQTVDPNAGNNTARADTRVKPAYLVFLPIARK